MKFLEDRMKILLVIGSFALVAGCAGTQETEDTGDAAAAAETQPAPAEPVAAEPTRETYTVVSGDHLWGISSKPRIYGNPYQWPLIYKANSDKIEDADLIHPGQVFDIDRTASAADIDAAIQHAKTRGAWSLGVVEESDKAYLAR